MGENKGDINFGNCKRKKLKKAGIYFDTEIEKQTDEEE